MKQKITLLTFILMILFSSSIFAVTKADYYAAIQFALGIYSENGESEEATPKVLTGRLGKYINENFSVEARYGIGSKDSFLTITTANGINTVVDIEVDNLIGIHAAGFFNLTSDIVFYGLLGYVKSELVFKAVGGKPINISDSAVSLGAGINIDKFNIEIIQYVNEQDYALNAISFGYVIEF